MLTFFIVIIVIYPVQHLALRTLKVHIVYSVICHKHVVVLSALPIFWPTELLSRTCSRQYGILVLTSTVRKKNLTCARHLEFRAGRHIEFIAAVLLTG